MADLPILFSGAMVRALLAGTKTQTRRIMTFPGIEHVMDFVSVGTDKKGRKVYEMKDRHGKFVTRPAAPGFVEYHWSPRIAVGDRFYVREEFSGPYQMKPLINPPKTWPVGTDIWYWADGDYPVEGDWTKPKPGMHMPRWASRITLEVTDVRVEQLQDISAEDAIAEGIERQPYIGNDPEYRDAFAWKDYSDHPWSIAGIHHEKPVLSYESLWDSINGEGAWAKNPWIVAYSFKTRKGNIDAQIIA